MPSYPQSKPWRKPVPVQEINPTNWESTHAAAARARRRAERDYYSVLVGEGKREHVRYVARAAVAATAGAAAAVEPEGGEGEDALLLEEEFVVSHILRAKSNPFVSVLALMDTTPAWNALELPLKPKGGGGTQVFHFKSDEGFLWGEIRKERTFVRIPPSLFAHPDTLLLPLFMHNPLPLLQMPRSKKYTGHQMTEEDSPDYKPRISPPSFSAHPVGASIAVFKKAAGELLACANSSPAVYKACMKGLTARYPDLGKDVQAVQCFKSRL